MLKNQENMPKEKPLDLRTIGLPKWPQMCVWGSPVTTEQAKEIIFRTDVFLTSLHAYGGGNNREWNQWAHGQLGILDIVNETGRFSGSERHELAQALAQELGHLDPEYIRNSWASCNFTGGPHGWCHPDGTIAYSDNVGKWPSAQQLLDDWTEIAQAFPFLSLTATVMSGEADAGTDEAGRRSEPVFSIVVRAGNAVAVQAIAPTAMPSRRDLATCILETNFHHGRREQGLPDAWIEELGVRYRAALKTVLEATEVTQS